MAHTIVKDANGQSRITLVCDADKSDAVSIVLSGNRKGSTTLLLRIDGGTIALNAQDARALAGWLLAQLHKVQA